MCGCADAMQERSAAQLPHQWPPDSTCTPSAHSPPHATQCPLHLCQRAAPPLNAPPTHRCDLQDSAIRASSPMLNAAAPVQTTYASCCGAPPGIMILGPRGHSCGSTARMCSYNSAMQERYSRPKAASCPPWRALAPDSGGQLPGCSHMNHPHCLSNPPPPPGCRGRLSHAAPLTPGPAPHACVHLSASCQSAGVSTTSTPGRHRSLACRVSTTQLA